MLLPIHKSSNGHSVSIFGRLLFHVTSASRKGLFHTVDLEGFEKWKTICDCESFKYGVRPCRHICACFEAISFWAGIPESNRDTWIDRLTFLISMGLSFFEAIESEGLKSIGAIPMPAPKPEEPEQKVREYKLTRGNKW